LYRRRPFSTKQMKGSSINLASLDIGSHTARLLVSECRQDTGALRPLLRRRAYIRLAKDFEIDNAKNIKPEAMERTLRVLDDFIRSARESKASAILAVATGLVREADNKDDFLSAIERKTGVRVRVVSGDEEAFLTGLGVVRALHLGRESFAVFDLGGGSTEFVVEEGAERKLFSLPLGAAICTERYLDSDPPEDKQIKAFESEVSETLQRAFEPLEMGGKLLVGTGGTVTALAAIIHRIRVDDISPERMDGLALTLEMLEALFQKMKRMSTRERIELLGIDQGRADVVVGGCLIVISLMRFLGAVRLTVSVSDLLEGILIDYVSKHLLA
jgi:exopolyphosphatase/guanosine-5'-triphosphate,3'-diphosphate pyrophosphatase